MFLVEYLSMPTNHFSIFSVLLKFSFYCIRHFCSDRNAYINCAFSLFYLVILSNPFTNVIVLSNLYFKAYENVSILLTMRSMTGPATTLFVLYEIRDTSESMS